MDRRKRCVVKIKERTRESEEKQKKRRENRESNHKKQVPEHVFSLRSLHIRDQSEIRYFGNSNLDPLSFTWKIISMSELGDIQGL